jgi:hypothetical protein
MDLLAGNFVQKEFNLQEFWRKSELPLPPPLVLFNCARLCADDKTNFINQKNNFDHFSDRS